MILKYLKGFKTEIDKCLDHFYEFFSPLQKTLTTTRQSISTV